MKTNKQELKALIFDMDGVLVDSEPLHLLAMQTFLQRFSIAYKEEDNRDFLGRKDLVIAEILIERFKLDMTARQFVDAKEEILADLIRTEAKARPGVYELLAELTEMQVPLAVASSATLDTIKLVMQTLSIGHYFQHLCSGEEVKNGKPAPDIFLMAAKRLALPPEYCLVVEDTLNGLKAAKAAGMFSVSIPCEATRHQDHSIADLAFSSLSELPLKELFC
ncbi:MAG: HAD family phosphatase [Candidatus Obscuribacterales bacterium]|nr:HAD family phosphatase [Candidatus Obscuribacterales bacterium]